MVQWMGLVGQRADVAVEVAAVAGEAGVAVIPLADPAHAPGDPAGVVVVDATLLAGALAGAGAGPGPAPGGPLGRAPVAVDCIVVCRDGEQELARAGAAQVGARHVVALPEGAAWLGAHLRRAPDRVVGVLGAVGGAGASTTAIGLAGGGGCGLLVDADPHSAGLDLPLGIPESRGARWPDIPGGPGPLDAQSLLEALPRVDGAQELAVLTGGTPGAGLPAVLAVARAEVARPVVDLGRGDAAVGLLRPGDAVVVVCPATISAVVGVQRVLADLPEGPRVLALRRSGWLPEAEVAEHLGIARVVVVPDLARVAEQAECGQVLAGRSGRALRSFGQRLWQELG